MILGLGIGEADATGTAALSAFLRAWNGHPPGFTAAELAGLLQAGADYGTKVNAGRPLQVSSDYDPVPLNQAIARATSDAETWRGRFPWPWQDATYYPKTGPEAGAVRKTLTDMYQAAAGVSGASATVAAAQADLKKDLVNPDRWAWLQAAKPYLILGGIGLAAAVAYPYVKPLLKRVS